MFAFNHAGFSTYSDNLVGFARDPLILTPIMVTVVIGSLGFPVIYELAHGARSPSRWSVHVVVIGLGRFGSSVVEALVRLGHHVLAVDVDLNLVQQWSDRLTHVVQASSIDADTLRSFGVHEFTHAANNGATVAELEAIFGWRGGGMASLYTKQADRERLAAAGASKLVDEKKNVYSRTIQKGAGRRARNQA